MRQILVSMAIALSPIFLLILLFPFIETVIAVSLIFSGLIGWLTICTWLAGNPEKSK